MAGRWEQFEKDGDRYLLQYRTVGDERVRQEHDLLNRVTSFCPPLFGMSIFRPMTGIVAVRPCRYAKGNTPKQTLIMKPTLVQRLHRPKTPKRCSDLMQERRKRLYPTTTLTPSLSVRPAPWLKERGRVSWRSLMTMNFARLVEWYNKFSAWTARTRDKIKD